MGSLYLNILNTIYSLFLVLIPLFYAATVSATFIGSFYLSQLKTLLCVENVTVFSSPHTHINTENEATCAYVKIQPNLN